MFIQGQQKKERRKEMNRMRRREQGKDKYAQTWWMMSIVHFV